jgi:cobalt/nickel transport system permease protein
MTCDLNPGHSILHRLDPRLKLAAVAAWSLLAALAQTGPAALFALAGALVFAVLGRLAPGPTARRLAAVNFFLIFIWLFLPFSVPGETVLTLGGLAVTRSGLEKTLILTLKVNAAALGALAFFGTSSVTQLAAAARRLGAPEKLTAVFLLTLRYFHVLKLEYARLRLALKVRAFRPGLNLHTLRTYANLVGILLVRGVDRAERVHAAMLCRGYTGRFWFHDHFRFTGRDWLGAVLLALMLSGGAALNVF